MTAEDVHAELRSLDELLDRVTCLGPEGTLGDDEMRGICAALDAPAACVYTVDPPGRLHRIGTTGIDPPRTIVIAESAVLAARCARSTKVLFEDDSTLTTRGDREFARLSGRLGAAPLVSRGRLSGVLLFAARPGVSLERCERIARIVAIATIHPAGGREDAPSVIDGDVAYLRKVLEAEPDGVLVFDPARGRLLANSALEQLLGRTIDPSRGLAQALGIVADADGRLLAVEELPSQRAMRDGRTIDEELLYLQPGGKRVFVRERAAPLRDEQGRVVGAIVVCRDVTSRHELLVEIAKERCRLQSIVDAAPDGLFYVEAATGRLLVNRAFEALLGHPVDPERGIAQKTDIIRAADGRALELDDFPSSRALRGESTTERELVYLHPDGRWIPVSESAAPVRAPDGSVLGAVVTVRDISTQKELARLREEFAAMVAHDLRNPVQSMLLQIRLMQQAAAHGRAADAHALRRLGHLAERLARMAGDLLDSTRVDLARVELDRQWVDLPTFVHDLIERIRPTVGDRTLVLKCEGPLPRVRLDATRVEQVLTNLVENAAKYSGEHSRIEVTLRRDGDGVEVAVIDDGIGIPPEELPRLFDRFHQVKRARRRGDGLGLGLYIARGYVEAHGGRLSVTSAVDRGSTFRMWLPAGGGVELHAPA